jgi:hypothetical protein
MSPWTLQLRSDFFAILCSLLAIRLLLNRSPGSIVLAGLLAAGAVLFKISMVAAMVGGVVWLLLSRRFRQAVWFGLAAVGTVVAGYGWFLVREPRMLQQMFAFVPPVREYQVYALMLWKICREPVLLLALGGLLLGPRALRNGERLVWLFAAFSAGAALLTNLQAGGNVNYYFEGLFAMVPFAAYCVIRLPRYTRAQTLPGILLPLLLVAGFLMPMAESIARQEVPALRAAPARDRSIVALDRVLKSRNIFSTAPRLALFSAHPPLTEPFLFTMLNRTGKVRLADLTEPLGRQAFDAVVTSALRRS